MPSKSNLPSALAQALDQFPQPSAYVVAFSGGTDSSVLLHALAGLRDRLASPVRAIHVNHALQRDADGWAERCGQVCAQLSVPFECFTVKVGHAAHGVEAAAREARYDAFAQALADREFLLTAHHRSDQAETLLLRLMRGTGVRGLSGIPRIRPLGVGSVARPLLDIPKTDLVDYAADHGIEAEEDPSNSDVSMDRNYLRHTIMPLLNARWPGYTQTLVRMAALAGESTQILDEVAVEDLKACAISKSKLSIARLRSLPASRQSQVLRTGMIKLGMSAPSRAQVTTLLGSLSINGNQAALSWGTWEARAYRDELHLLHKLPELPEDYQNDWRTGATCELPEGLGRLELRNPSAPEQDCAVPQPMTVRFRQGGERIQLSGESFHRQVKKLFQDAQVPPWERNRTPLLWVGSELWAIGNRWRNGPCAAWLADHKIRLAWQNCTLVDDPHE